MCTRKYTSLSFNFKSIIAVLFHCTLSLRSRYNILHRTTNLTWGLLGQWTPQGQRDLILSYDRGFMRFYALVKMACGVTDIIHIAQKTVRVTLPFKNQKRAWKIRQLNFDKNISANSELPQLPGIKQFKFSAVEISISWAKNWVASHMPFT